MISRYSLLIIGLFLSISVSGQGYFYWPYPNTEIPDSVHQFFIVDGEEEYDIRQYYIANEKGIIVEEYSLSFSEAKMKWEPLSKTEIDLNNAGEIITKRNYLGNGITYVLSSVDSVYKDVGISNLYHITIYSVDVDGIPTMAQEYREYYLDQQGRDSIEYFYNEQWDEIGKNEYHQGGNYTSTHVYQFIQSEWVLLEIDSFTFYNDLFVYTYEVFDENGNFIIYSIDTMFLDSKGRLDFGKFYIMTDNGFEYVYKFQFYNSDMVLIEGNPNLDIHQCNIITYPNREIYLNENEGNLVIYSLNGNEIINYSLARGRIEVPGFVNPGIYIFQLRERTGKTCIQKLLIK